MSTLRYNYFQLSQKSFKNLLALSDGLNRELLGRKLVELVLLRVSQINGCAFCIDMHYQDLLKQDVDPRHINAVAGWREAPFFSERERAALEWAELVNAIPFRDPDDAAFARVKAHFSDEEIAELGFVVAVIRSWNMLNVASRNPIPR
jgi:AhpD family alkylhydroperoxidase